MKTEEKRDPSQWRITDNQGKTQDPRHCKAPSPLRIKDKPGKIKNPSPLRIIEDRRKEGSQPMENHGQSRTDTGPEPLQSPQPFEDQGQTRGKKNKEQKNRLQDAKGREQSKTTKRRNDALGDLGGCCFMYEKIRFSTLAAQRLLPKRSLALQNTCKK